MNERFRVLSFETVRVDDLSLGVDLLQSTSGRSWLVALV